MAGTPLKAKVLGGVWASVGGIGCIVSYRRSREFEMWTPCSTQAIQRAASSDAARRFLGDGDLRLASWPLRSSAVDKDTGRTTAKFALQNDAGELVQVLMAARRNKQGPDNSWSGGDEDELAIQVSGWRSVFSRPWELKVRFSERLRKMREGPPSADEAAAEAEKWQLDALVVFPTGVFGSTAAQCSESAVLLGDARAVPDYECICVRGDAAAKTSHSRYRLQCFVALVACGAMFAGGIRLRRSWHTAKSYGFVQGALIKHTVIREALGSTARVQSSSGKFEPSYINARLRLVTDAGAAADVDFSALRDETTPDRRWRINLARMNVGGRLYNLDKAQF